jgi:hypothetical protein
MSERRYMGFEHPLDHAYLAAWIHWPDGYWHCRHCRREVGTGHPAWCPIARLDYVARDGT